MQILDEFIISTEGRNECRALSRSVDRLVLRYTKDAETLRHEISVGEAQGLVKCLSSSLESFKDDDEPVPAPARVGSVAVTTVWSTRSIGDVVLNCHDPLTGAPTIGARVSGRKLEWLIKFLQKFILEADGLPQGHAPARFGL